MVLDLMRTELKRIWRHPAYRVGCLVFLGLALFAAYGQRGAVEGSQKRIQEAKAAEEARFEENKALLASVENGESQFDSLWDDPRGYFLWHKTIAVFPIHPFAALSVGQRDLFDNIAEIGIYARPQAKGRELRNPTIQLFGGFDLAFVLVYLLPLFILGFSYDIVSGERERGTLRLLLALPVSAGSLFGAKLAARFLAIVFMASVAIAAAMAVAGLDLFRHAADLGALALIVAVYSAFWFLLALAVNAFGKSSAMNALALIVLWALFAILGPTLINTLAATVYPPPSRIAMVNDLRGAANEAEKRGSELLAKYYSDHPELAMEDVEDADARLRSFFDYYQRMFVVRQWVDADAAETKLRFERQLDSQRRLERLLNFASPVALTRESLDELAGASSTQFHSFQKAVAGFGKRWHGFFMEKAVSGKLIGSEDLGEFPVFAFEIQRLTIGLVWRLAIMMALNLALAMVVAWRLRRRVFFAA